MLVDRRAFGRAFTSGRSGAPLDPTSSFASESTSGFSSVDVRFPGLRVGAFSSENIATDFGLLERGSPFVHRLSRPQVTILLAGRARFEEGEHRTFVDRPSWIVSDVAQAGTEAYAGASCRYLLVTWDPAVYGAPISGRFVTDRLGEQDRARLAQAANDLSGPDTPSAVATILSILRSLGLGFRPASADDLTGLRPASDLVRLHEAMGLVLTRLDRHPSVDDVADLLGWNVRKVHRRFRELREANGHSFSHWREALRQTRLLHALRLLSAPGATTELVAREAGFRAPTALCHALSEAGLPSPGSLVKAARKDVLGEWGELVPLSRRPA